jgi:hypothetical protein
MEGHYLSTSNVYYIYDINCNFAYYFNIKAFRKKGPYLTTKMHIDFLAVWYFMYQQIIYNKSVLGIQVEES